jgi:hypothetical protein
MKSNIKFLILLFVIILPGIVTAQQQADYNSTITVSIPDQDTVFARNNAFQSLKRQILIDAIKDQLGVIIYEEHASQILRHKDIKASELISAYQILQEYSIGEKFTMKLQGTIRVDVLNETLRKMNLILKDDPWYNITLVADNNINIPIELLQQKLDIYHIKIHSLYTYDSNSTQVDDHQDVTFIEDLFLRFPENQILFFIQEEKNSESNLINGLRIRIFRKADFQQVTTFTIKFRKPVDPSLVNRELKRNKSRFISAFSVQTCKRHLYDEGLESFIDINVAGLTNPFERNEFEKYVLKKNSGIQSYFLKNISNEAVDYELYSKYSIARLMEYFEAKNEAFDIIPELNGINQLKIYAIYKLGQDIVELDTWQYDNNVVEQLNKILNETEEFDETLIPDVEEKEPNNNSRRFNYLPNGTLLIGKISSRADEDIYQVEEPLEDISSINIEWMLGSKTSLSPQLKLYDDNFKFLNSYSLLGHQNRIKFSYTFQLETPKRIYIRVSDAVGFIQGETGGYKSYDYLLKVQWKN